MHTPPATVDEIIQLAHARSTALVTKDRAALDRLLSDTFRYTNASGVVFTKAEYFEQYVDAANVFWKAQAMDDIEVLLHQDTAIVTCRVRDQADFDGQSFDEYYRSTFVWIREQGVWRCAAGHTSSTAAPEQTNVFDI